jgi:hypothetical protein
MIPIKLIQAMFREWETGIDDPDDTVFVSLTHKEMALMGFSLAANIKAADPAVNQGLIDSCYNLLEKLSDLMEAQKVDAS